jgi:hypothetical protein
MNCRHSWCPANPQTSVLRWATVTGIDSLAWARQVKARQENAIRGANTKGRIDPYKRGCFVVESDQFRAAKAAAQGFSSGGLYRCW